MSVGIETMAHDTLARPKASRTKPGGWLPFASKPPARSEMIAAPGFRNNLAYGWLERRQLTMGRPWQSHAQKTRSAFCERGSHAVDDQERDHDDFRNPTSADAIIEKSFTMPTASFFRVAA